MSFTGEPLTCFDQQTRIRLAKMLLLEIERDQLNDALHRELRNEPVPDIKLAQAMTVAIPERHGGESIGGWLTRSLIPKND